MISAAPTRSFLFLMAVLVWGAGCAAPRSAQREMPAEGGGQAIPASFGMDAPARSLPDEVVAPEGFQEAVAQGTRTEEGRPGPNYWVNRPTYDLDVRLLPEEKRLEGTAHIRYRNNSPDSLGILVLELVQNLHREGVQRNTGAEITGGMQIEHLAVDGSELEASAQGRPAYEVSGTRLIVAPAAPVLPGATTELDVDYSFAIPQQGASGRMGYSGAELYGETNLFYIGYFYPIMSVYDDVKSYEDLQGWMDDRFLGQAEFYSDHGDYTLSVEAPAAWTVQATGTLQNPEAVLRSEVRQRRARAYQSDEPVMILQPGQRATPGGQDRYTWEFTADNVRDVAFSATTQSHWEGARTPVGDRDGDGQTDYAHINSFWREQAPLWSEMTRYEQDVITHHSAFTGVSYPWPHMTAVEGAGIIGGGMEYPMMTIMGPYTGSGPEDLYAVTAHELAHMWVPMIVSTNERRYSWMDEGTTTFNEAEARADFYPDNGTRPHVEDQERYLSAVRAGVEAPVLRWSNFHYTGAAFGTASYPKPASLLQALRGLLGEEAFLETYHRFMNTWAYKHPLPYDLFNAFETAYGEDMDWFWDSFYVKDWTLDQALTSVANTGNGVTITVADEGRAVMPVDLRLTMENGETMDRRIPVDPWLQGQRQVNLALDTPARVERVEIDPARYYPDIDRSDNVWTQQQGVGAAAPASGARGGQ